MPAVEKEWNLEPFWEATVGGIVFSGMLMGAPFWGVLSDNFGRKFGFFCSVALTGTFGLASAFSPSLPFLLLSRVMVGFGLGGSTVAFSQSKSNHYSTKQ